MAALIYAELLSIRPVLIVGAPQVAVVSILLPTLSTGCNVQVTLILSGLEDIFWAYLWNTLKIFWGYPGDIWGILRGYLGNIWGIF